MTKDKKMKFPKLPTYPSGAEGLKKFIQANLHYPKDAIDHKIEGFVFVEYHVSDYGDVLDARVIKGLGYGCDEEALRIVKLLSYEKAKNRGVIITSNMKIKINFKLPIQSQITYSYKTSETSINKSSSTISYSIKF